MGIERFFSTLSEISTVWEKKKYPYSKKNTKILLIDFNSIIHFTSTRVLSSIKDLDLEQSQIENEILLNIKKYLEHLISDIVNLEYLETIYIAIDGVPSFGKIREQQKRRYMGSLIKSSSKWSKTNITPGTKFMRRLNNYLNITLKEFEEELGIKNIILSDSNEPGEGETKIINYLRDLKLPESQTEIMIFSPDSDMVLLNLLIKSDFIVTLLRFNQQESDLNILNNDKNVYEEMEMKNFRKYLVDYLEEKTGKDLEERKVIRDIILIFNCFGNDFLPKIMSINLKIDFLKVIDLYGISLVKNDGYLINDGKITWSNLRLIFELLEKDEYSNLKMEHLRFTYHNFDRVLYNNFYQDVSVLEEKIVNIKLKFLTRNYSLAKVRCPNPTIINLSQCLNLKAFYEFYHSQYDNKYDYNKKSLRIKPDNNVDLNNDIYYGVKNEMIDLSEDDKSSFMYFYYLALRLVDLNEIYLKLYRNNLNASSYINKKSDKNRNLIKTYKSLYYHLTEPTELLDDIISYYYLFNNIPVIDKDINLKKSSYDRLSFKPRNFNSKSRYHIEKINELEIDQIETYKMTNFLDKYYGILKPYLFDEFPSKESYEKIYNKKYFDSSDQNKLYLEGINWVFNHYLKGKTDKLWYYPYSHSPLLKSILSNYDKITSSLSFEVRENNLKPHQQFIMVTPYKKGIEKLINFDEEDIKKIYKDLIDSKLIPKEVTLENIDCSGSIFFSKCHPNILEKIDLVKLRNYFLE